MEIEVNNDKILIKNGSNEFIDFLTKRLSYKDKSIEYQIRKMESNPFQKNSPYLSKLKKQLYGSLIKNISDNEYVIPSGFYHIVKKYDGLIDNRCETGENISLPWDNKPFSLRDYQEQAVEQMEENYRGTINLATGLGKTLTAIHAIRRFKKKTLVVCPGVSIADNFYEELCSAFGSHRIGYYGNGKKKIKDITVAIAGSVNNNIEKFKEIGLGLVIFDEVHHLAASTFFTIADKLADIGRMYGLTATNFRSDGKDVMIEAGVGPSIIQKDLIWGIENKWLRSPYFVVREIPTVGRDYKGDKLKNYKAHVLNEDTMNARIISDAQKFISANKSVLILVKEISHGKLISEALMLPFATGSDKQSSEYVKQLNEGKIPGLVGTDSKIGEGTDTKNVDVLILANFVASKGPLWQNIGRGLRIHKDKDTVVILDYIPLGSKMLTRHAKQRLKYYEEITHNVSLR